MKLHKAETPKKQLTVGDLKRGEIGTMGDCAAVFHDGAIFRGIQIDDGYLRAVAFAHSSPLNATYPAGSKLVIDYANSKIEVLPPNEEPKPQLTTGDLKPGQIGMDGEGDLVMCFEDETRYWLSADHSQNEDDTFPIVRILPKGTLLGVE